MSANSQNSQMLSRELGNTGEEVSAIGLDGWHIGLPNVDEELGIRIMWIYLCNLGNLKVFYLNTDLV